MAMKWSRNCYVTVRKWLRNGHGMVHEMVPTCSGNGQLRLPFSITANLARIEGPPWSAKLAVRKFDSNPSFGSLPLSFHAHSQLLTFVISNSGMLAKIESSVWSQSSSAPWGPQHRKHVHEAVLLQSPSRQLVSSQK